MGQTTSVPWDKYNPYFYFVPAAIARSLHHKSLPRMQTMRDQQQLIKLQIDLGAAFRGVGLVKKILFVSHRWEYPGNPDPDGVQFSKVKEYLHDHPEIEFIWFDFSCMPQRESETVDRRTSAELDEFQNMLSAIADLYLTSRVLMKSISDRRQQAHHMGHWDTWGSWWSFSSRLPL